MPGGFFHIPATRRFQALLLVAFLFVLTLVSARIARADWTAPTAPPPGGNVTSPINTSGVSQTKQGSLKIGGELLTVDSGDLLMASGDLFLSTINTGLYWTDVTNPADNSKAHLNYDATRTLYISSGDAGDHIELQGPVKLSQAGLNDGSLTIDNDASLHYLLAESTKVRLVNSTYVPAAHIGELSVADSTAGVDLKSFNSPLYLNADTLMDVNVGSKTAASRLCLNDDGSGTDCIDDWAVISGGGVSGTARYIPKFNDTGDGLVDSIIIETDTFGFKSVGIGDANPTNARLSVGLVDNDRASIQLDATNSPTGGYAWNIHSTAFNHPYGASKFVIEAQGADAEKSLVINRIGHAGLGTDFPTARLNVKGRADGGNGDQGTVSIDPGNLRRVFHCALCGATTFTFFGPGDTFVLESTPEVSRTIESVTDDNELIVTVAFPSSANGLSFHVIPSIARFSDANANPNTASKFLIDPNGNVRIANIPNCTGNQTLDTDALGNITCGVDAGAVGGDNYTVKVSANDTTDNFLGAKLVAGANITLTELNNGANETLRIDASGTGTSLWEAGASANTINPVNETTDKVAIGHNTIADSTQLSIKNNSVNAALYSEQSNASGYAGYFSGKTVVMNGNFGIGDATPLSPLTVGSGDPFRVDASGNLVRIYNVAYDWPAVQGGANTVLTNNGGGLLTWAPANSGSNFWETGATANTINPVNEATDKVAIGHNSIGDSTRLSVKANSVNATLYAEQSNTAGWAGYFSGKTFVSFADNVNDIKDVLHLQRSLTAGVGSNGLGGSLRFDLINGAGASKQASSIDTVWEDAASTTEDSSLRFSTIVGGSLREAVRIDDNGNVGVGLSNPTSSINVYRNGAATFRLQNNLTGINSADGLKLSIGNTESYLWNYENADMYLGTNNIERVTIQAGGNVGIGDISPSSLLTVGNGDRFQVNSSGNIVKINNITYSWPAAQGAAGTFLQNNGSGTLAWASGSGGNDNLGNHIATQNLQMGSYYISSDGGNEGINIDSAGRVALSNTPSGSGETFQLREPGGGSEWAGFGYDGAGNMLSVAVHSGSQVQTFQIDYDDPVFSFDTATNADALVIKKDGSVGIGTSGPDTRLKVVGATTTDQLALGQGSNGYLRLGSDSADNAYIASNASHRGSSVWNFVNLAAYSGQAARLSMMGSFGFATASGGTNPISWNTRLFIANDGKVGIGTTAPNELLEINGNIRGNQNGAIRIQTASGNFDLGSQNSSYAHLYTDRPRFYFNKKIIVDGSYSSYSNNDLVFETGETPRITVIGNAGKGATPGNVGIANSDPASLLTVASAASPHGSDHTIAGYNNSTVNYNAIAGFKSGAWVSGSGVYGEVSTNTTCGDNQICAGTYGSIDSTINPAGTGIVAGVFGNSGSTNGYAGAFTGNARFNALDPAYNSYATLRAVNNSAAYTGVGILGVGGTTSTASRGSYGVVGIGRDTTGSQSRSAGVFGKGGATGASGTTVGVWGEGGTADTGEYSYGLFGQAGAGTGTRYGVYSNGDLGVNGNIHGPSETIRMAGQPAGGGLQMCSAGKYVCGVRYWNSATGDEFDRLTDIVCCDL